ncbi:MULTISPECIES: low molecular weight protein-tyrosine-phosphatase [unclassified Moraxella]|uniref:low molecular weight protein-tyrosine-phosphatase n=1 Tax=unclassified Moraxella TaxID=2685852 RepID=UPI003AF4AF33
MLVNNILVVCVGNICRSPIGEAMLQAKFPNMKVSSAGISALVGNPADDNAIQVMDEIGIDMRSHRARQLNAELMQQADLVLCMSAGQERWIKDQWAMHRGKVYQLGKWINKEVDDPYRLPLAKFYEAREVIDNAVSGWECKLAK